VRHLTDEEVQRGLKEAGHYIFAITPTASAAQVLRKEGFPKATTVEDFLRNVEKRVGLRRAVVICDEAGLKSNRQGAELLRLAQRHDMRVLLVGDVRQHVSVEAGEFLRVLEAHSQLGRCQVGEIHRLTTAWLSCKWLWEMSGAGWRNWITSTVLRKVNPITWNTRRRTIYSSPMRRGIWIAAWPCRSLGRRTIGLRLDSQWPERTRRASRRGNVSYGQRIASLDESAKAGLAPV
jgi:hypothetical protein